MPTLSGNFGSTSYRRVGWMAVHRNNPNKRRELRQCGHPRHKFGACIQLFYCCMRLRRQLQSESKYLCSIGSDYRIRNAVQECVRKPPWTHQSTLTKLGQSAERAYMSLGLNTPLECRRSQWERAIPNPGKCDWGKEAYNVGHYLRTCFIDNSYCRAELVLRNG